MVLYLDIIVFLNFVVNYCFFKLIYILFNEKENMFRLILASFISVLFLLFFLLDYQIYNLMKIIGGVVLVLIAFKYSNKYRFIFMCCMYYLLNFSFIGVLSIFNVKGCTCLAFLFLICLLILIYSKRRNICLEKEYKIIIEVNKRTMFIDGYLDTGNLASYLDKPIVFLNKKYESDDFYFERNIKIQTVNGENYISCFRVDKFIVIDNKRNISKDVLIAFVNMDKDINCLLNYLLF